MIDVDREPGRIGEWWRTIDRGLFGAACLLIVTGIFMVMASSPPVAMRIEAPPYHFVERHLILLVPAIILFLSMSVLPVRWVWRVGLFGLICSIVFMVAVLFVGTEIKGAQRWIQLPGFSLQPSEFVKPAFAIVAAWLMARQKEVNSFRGNKMCAGLYGLIVLLLLLQPDFGMTVVLSAMFGAQIFVAGLPFRYLIIVGLGGVVLLIGAYFTLDHVQSRIDRFLNPASGDSYQVDRSLEAFQNGGLLGTGPGQGTVKNRLPDAHADFVFAVAGEEYGFVFTLFIVIVYAYILLHGLKILSAQKELFPMLAGSGLLVMLSLQAIVHIGSSLHLLPAKGMTLPFLSYGGSSLLAVSFSMGVILALTRQPSRKIFRSGARHRFVNVSD